VEHPVVAGDGEDGEERRHVEADLELGLVAGRVGAPGRALDVAAAPAAVGPRLVEHLHGAVVGVERVGGARVGARLGLERGREARDLVPPPRVPLQVQVPHHPHGGGGHRASAVGGGVGFNGGGERKEEEVWRMPDANACGGSVRDRQGMLGRQTGCGRRGGLWAIRSRSVLFCSVRVAVVVSISVFWTGLLPSGLRFDPSCWGVVVLGCRRAAASQRPFRPCLVLKNFVK